MIDLHDELKGFEYQNVTISGLPGCGSTTILNSLRNELTALGWRGFSGGEFMRQYAMEKGLLNKNDATHHDASLYSDDFDREVDYGIREKLETEKQWIIESWLAGFMAQGVPKTLKILMVCESDAVRIDRVINRDDISVMEAKKNVLERYEKNLKNWSKIYKQEWQEWVVKVGKAKPNDQVDFWQRNLYDLVIDTYSMNQEQSLALALSVLRGEGK
jgi:cytidylate kinase